MPSTASTDAQVTALRRDLQRLTEQVQVLARTRRGGDRSASAVTIFDMQALSRFPSEVTSIAVSAAPGQDDFNALREDVRAIYHALGVLAARLDAIRG